MLVINTIRYLFPKLSIEHQASPSWLRRQRYDGYIAQHRVAVEYNGEQHYHPIERFGGEHGLRHTQERDRKKLELSAEHGVEVIVFRYDDLLSETAIRDRIQKAIDRQRKRECES